MGLSILHLFQNHSNRISGTHAQSDQLHKNTGYSVADCGDSVFVIAVVADFAVDFVVVAELVVVDAVIVVAAPEGFLHIVSHHQFGLHLK